MKSFLHCVFDHLQENHHNKDTRKTKKEQKSKSNDDLEDKSNDDDEKRLYVIEENKNITIYENKTEYDFHVSSIIPVSPINSIYYFDDLNRQRLYYSVGDKTYTLELKSGVKILLKDNCILHAPVTKALIREKIKHKKKIVFSTHKEDGIYYDDNADNPDMNENMFKIIKLHNKNEIQVKWIDESSTKTTTINLNNTPIYVMRKIINDKSSS